MNFNQPPSNSGPFSRENEPAPVKAGLAGEQTLSGSASPKLNQSGKAPSSETTGKEEDDKSSEAEPLKLLREAGSNAAAAQRDRVVSQVGSISNAARETAKRLRDENDNNIAGYIESVADHIDSAADYLRNASAGQLIGDVQSVARRHPELVVGGMFVTGLVIARFLKAGTKEAVRTASNSASWSDEDEESDVDSSGYLDENFGAATGGFGRERQASNSPRSQGSDVKSGLGSTLGSSSRTAGSAIDESGYVGEGTVEKGNYGGGSSSTKKNADKDKPSTVRKSFGEI